MTSAEYWDCGDMLILAVEASTRVASVALARDEIILREFKSDNPKMHSEVLNQAIADLLEKENLNLNQIDLFAVSTGPGSFTGVRVALNIIRTFSYLFKKPIFTADSLEILKNHENVASIKDTICMINAYKNMVYSSIYLDGELVLGPEATQVIEIERIINEFFVDFSEKKLKLNCIGDGYEAYKTIFSKIENLVPIMNEEISYPKASTLAKMAFSTSNSKEKKDSTLDWKSVIPLYLRASAAEENLK